MWKRIFPIFVAILLFPLAPALAEGTIQVDVEPGFDGMVKQFRWAPVTITVTHQAGAGSGQQGEALSGELVVMVAPENNRFASYLFPMDLPPGVSKKVTMTLPVYGADLNHSKMKIAFYEGGFKTGKAVEGLKVEPINASARGPKEALIGALTQDPDGLKYFLGFKEGWERSSLAFLNKDNVPEQSIGLDPLDLLIVNRFPLDSLNSAQLDAIRMWVEGGGTLVLGGGGSYQSTLVPLQDLSPVQVSGTEEWSDFSVLSRYAGETLPSAGKVILSRGELVDGKVLVADQDIPLVAYRDYGRGKVIYAAFDLAADPFSSWKGNGKLWGRILAESGAVLRVQGEKFAFPSDSIAFATKHFPGLKMPSLPVLVFSYLFYILLITFVLYFILKRLDRREWLWFAVPLCAVVFSAVIFVIGASDRISGILRNTVAIVELDGNGTGNGQAASAMFVPAGGDYRIESDAPVFPVQDMYLQDPLQQAGSVLIYPGEKNRLEFRDVDYWSLHMVQAELRGQPYGKVEGNLYVENGVLKGTVTNKTKFDLKEAYLFAGSRKVSLGAVKREETKTVELRLGTQGIQDLSPSSGFSQQLRSSYPNQEDWRKNYLADFLEPLEATRNVPFPLLAAWVEEPLFQYEIDGRIHRDHQLSLVYQYLPVSFQDENRFVIRHGDVVPLVAEGNHVYQRMNIYIQKGLGSEISMMAGTAVLDYRLPVPGEGLAEELEVKINSGQGSVRYEIYNWDLSSWEGIPQSTVLENPERYVRNNSVRLRITSSVEQHFMEPTIAVKGVVKRD